MNFKKRLLEFLQYLGIGQTKFEEKTGLGRASVSKIKDGMSAPNLAKILKAYPELNIEWLLTGEGNMIKDDNPQMQYSGTNNNQSESLYGSQAVIKLLKEQLSDKQDEINRLYREIGKLEATINNKDADSLIVIKGGDNPNVKDKVKLTGKSKSSASKE